MAREVPNSYKDPYWQNLAEQAEAKTGIPSGLLRAIINQGERSNNNQVSEAGARSPFQIIPATRDAIVKKYGIDPYASHEEAAEGAALLLKEGLDRNRGSIAETVGEYHGGIDRKNWGPRTKAYIQRVSSVPDQQAEVLAKFNAWKAGRQANAPAVQQTQADPANQESDVLAKFNAWKASKQQVAQPNDVPTPENLAADRAQPVSPKPGLLEQNLNNLVGLGEAGLSALTGATGGALGAIGGAASGLVDSIRGGTFGTQQGVQQVQQQAMQGAEALTYAPRTQTGQEIMGAVGEAASALPPFIPAVGQAGAISGAARAAAPVAGVAAQKAGQVVKQAAQTSADVIKRLPAQVQERIATQERFAQRAGSVGARGTDVSTVRRQAAAELPIPIELTKGQATREFGQVQFEREAAKNADSGAPLRGRFSEQNKQLLMNMDAFIDQTGAETVNKIQTGKVITKALMERAEKDKAQINQLYKAAENSPEARQPVRIDSMLDYINNNKSEAAVSPVLKFARSKMVELGMAQEGQDGSLIGRPVTLLEGERLRKAIGAATSNDAPDIRQATILKSLYDMDTEGAGGALYKSARRARENFAKRFENRAVIADLLETKRNSDDRRVALEDVQSRIIDRGSKEDLTMLAAILENSGDSGKQALRELRGATLMKIKAQATKSAGSDDAGNPLVSADKLNSAIRSLDDDGKLEKLYGKKGAEQLRTLSDVAKVVLTVPPGSVNTSNTASVLAAMLDATVMTATAGSVPVPVASGVRLLVKKIKDKKIQKRIEDALNGNKKEKN